MKRIIKSKNDERQDILVEVILEKNVIRFTGRYKLKNLERMIIEVVEIDINSNSETINEVIGNLAITINDKILIYLNIVEIFNIIGDDITVEILND